MTVQTGEIRATLTIATPKIKDAADLRVRVDLTNTSAQPVRLNALFFDFTTIMLKVRRDDGTRVNPGPPPLPPIDDGTTGRVDLAPGASVSFSYSGADYFAQEVPPGHYQVRFRHEPSESAHGDWTGAIETEWVPFEVAP